LLDPPAPLFGIDVALTDAEVESMGDEHLIETGFQMNAPEGQRFAIVSILPEGRRMLISKNLHIPRIFVEAPPKTISQMIGSTTGKVLLSVATAALAVLATYLLNAYLE
jgi:hypothetical protein